MSQTENLLAKVAQGKRGINAMLFRKTKAEHKIDATSGAKRLIQLPGKARALASTEYATVAAV